MGLVLGLGSRELLRHLKSCQGSFCGLDSNSAFRLAMAAKRFASARFLCSSVISMTNPDRVREHEVRFLIFERGNYTPALSCHVRLSSCPRDILS